MINKQILNYKITELIGQGGMATVYAAEHIKLSNKKAAIKILDPMLSGNKSVRERFKNEANIMAGLEHENVVRVFDYEDENGTLAIVMEKLDGIDLTQYIKKHGALKPEKAVEMMKQILNAFAYAHHNKIVHRDVKPSNVFIETEKKDNIKILDFGIAKLLEGGAEITRTGMFMGTPLYMSPEQADDVKHIDHRSDIYSLGVTFYFMLAGKAPYDASTMSSRQISNKIADDLLPEIPNMPEFNKIIKNATAKKLKNRYQTCEEFIVNLEAFEKPSSVLTDKNDQTRIYKPEHTDDNLSDLENETKIHESVVEEQETIIENKDDNIVEGTRHTSSETVGVDRSHTDSNNKKKKNKLIIPIIAVVIIIIGLFIWKPWEPSYVYEYSDDETSTFTDSRDGKTYKTVKIGNQTWMAENLAYKASSGCWAYNDDESNVAKYGYLYNWETAKTVCPSGWHLPTKAEFETLLNNYGNGNDNEEDWNANYTALIPKGESGFSASFGGWRYSSGDYSIVGTYGNFWSSSTKDDATAWRLYMYSTSERAYINDLKKSVGFSARCLQDN